MEGDSNLEVDARQSGLYSSPGGSEPKYKSLEPDGAGAFDSGAYGYRNPAAERPRHILGLRPTTFALSTILAIVMILGIVSAVGAGTCASKNGGFTGSNPPVTADAQSQQEGQQACPPTASGIGPNNITSNSTTTLQPTTSCHTLPSQYGAKVNSEQFTLYCNTDFVGNDFIGIFVYRFEDCIQACASFNYWSVFDAQCSHVAYTIDPSFSEASGKGNCYLKNGTGTGTTSNSTSGAVLVKA